MTTVASIVSLVERMQSIRTDGIYYAGLTRVQAPLSVLLEKQGEYLHPNEQDSLSKLTFPKRQHSYLLGRVAAKKAVNALLPGLDPRQVWIDRGLFEFPIVRCPEAVAPIVSISHAGDSAFAVATDQAHPMAIDAEEPRLDRCEAIATQLTGAELALLKSTGLSTERAHALIWTMKEAISKVIRTGMMTPFELFELNALSSQEPVWLGLYKNFAQYKTVAFRSAGLVCSLVLPRRSEIQIPPAFVDGPL
jgi:4'-phosphopantetheinyl transferase